METNFGDNASIGVSEFLRNLKFTGVQKNSQNSQKTPVLEPLFDKLQTSDFAKRQLQDRRFIVNFEKYCRTSFFFENIRPTAPVCTCTKNVKRNFPLTLQKM